MLILAGGNTAAAEHALGVVALQILGGEILLAGGHSTLKAVLLLDAHVVAQLLELAVTTALTGQTFLIVDGQQQLQGHPAGFLDLGRIGENLHPFVDRIDTGSHQRAGPLHLHHAHAAGANLVDILQIAQGGNINTGVAGGFQNGGIRRHFIGNAVDLNIDLIHVRTLLPYFLTTAPNLHFSMQTPHLMHLVVSMTWGCLTEPLMAPTGQLRAHRVQPLHLSATME